MITEIEKRVIRAVGSLHEAYPTELQKKAGLKDGSLYATLDRLTEAGVFSKNIARKSQPSSYYFKLTEAGKYFLLGIMALKPGKKKKGKKNKSGESDDDGIEPAADPED